MPSTKEALLYSAEEALSVTSGSSSPVSVPTRTSQAGSGVPVQEGNWRSRTDRWHDIWLRKGSGQQANSRPLHHVNGFLQLDQEQYDNLVSIVTLPINVKAKSRVLDCGCGGMFIQIFPPFVDQLLTLTPLLSRSL